MSILMSLYFYFSEVSGYEDEYYDDDFWFV